jgi:serine/threonine-protein kinase RsbT
MLTGTQQQRVFRITGLADVVNARRQGLDMAIQLGFHLAEATKIAVVISELGRNIERYAGTGTITIIAQSSGDAYIQIVAEDRGPGIPDIDRVLAGGYTTSRGMGLGLSGSRRLMDTFSVKSTIDVGTTVRAVKWLKANH